MTQVGDFISDKNISESSLHSDLKKYLCSPGDKVEQRIGNFIIDVIKGDTLIEVQTSNFSAIKTKLMKLLETYKVLLVHPIIKDKWIHKYDMKSKKLVRKSLSPKHCSFLNIFDELIWVPRLLMHPNLIVELFLIQVKEDWINDGNGSWRRKGWSIKDKKLIKILDQKLFSNPNQLLTLIPDELVTPFTNFDLCHLSQIPISLARKMTYCLRKMELIEIVGKRDRSNLYNRLLI